MPVVMISGHGTIETAVAAIKRGAYDFIEKPFKADRLLLVVARAIEAARLRRENASCAAAPAARSSWSARRRRSPQRAQPIEQVAPTGSRVLITGPAGAGKEVAARLIHRGRAAPTGRSSCSTAPPCRPERVEKELFGTEAEPDGPRRSRVSARSSGRMAARCCSTKSPTCRWRPRARSSRAPAGADLRAGRRRDAGQGRRARHRHHQPRPAGEIAAGRLPRGPVLPAQRRAAPRAGAARAAGGRAGAGAASSWRASPRRRGLPPRELGEDALAALQAYDWPGNVRQLRNVIDWLLIMAPGERRTDPRRHAAAARSAAIAPAVLSWEKGGEIMTLPLREARELFERSTWRPRSRASAATSPAPRPSSAWSARRCTAS